MISRFVKFERAAREEPVVSGALKDSEEQFNENNDREDLAAVRVVIDNRFLTLQRFCGGLTTVFSDSTTVASKFLIIGWEKDDTRMGLTDFSLEGISYCK